MILYFAFFLSLLTALPSPIDQGRTANQMTCQLDFESFTDSTEDCRLSILQFSMLKYPALIDKISTCAQKRPRRTAMCAKPLDDNFQKIGQQAISISIKNKERNKEILAAADSVIAECGHCIL
jgi:hypothetical protein